MLTFANITPKYQFGLKKLFYSLFLTFTIITSQAQPSGMSFKVFGKVQDADTKEPLEFATVSVHQLQDDKLINGTLVARNGEFEIDGLRPGKYTLKVSFMGYIPYSQQVVISPPNFEIDLGNIKIKKDLKQLALVEIADEKPSMTMNLDRKVYNVDKDITAAGGTAQDVLANVPGVLVDNEGNVSVRGSRPQIFIDGRPTLLELEQIPVEDIERIEVITNPSAQFDANTTGGIINIVLKKNLKPGYNGMIAVGAGTNGRANAMASLNLRLNKWNFSFSNSFRYVDVYSLAFTDRKTFTDTITDRFRQDSENRRNRHFNFGRVGIDYKINNRTTISFNQNYNIGGMSMFDDQEYFFSRNNLPPFSTGFQQNELISNYLRYTAQLQLVRQSPKEGREWVADITYNRATRNSNSQFDIQNFDENGILEIIGPEIHRGSESGHLFRVQGDYADKLSNGAKLDIGFNSNTRLNSSFLTVDRFDIFNQDFSRDTLLSNQFEITEIINAAYIQYGQNVGKNSFSGGLRFEQTYFVGELTDKGQRFEYIYPRGTENLLKAFFPTFFYSRKLNEKNEFQVNFARKIGRPGFFQSMPFVFFSDRQNYRIGNPNLAPEFYNQVEFNYNRNLKNGNLLLTTFGKLNEDIITQYVFRSPEDSSVLIQSFLNGNTSYNWGLEANFGLTFNKKISFNLNLNGQYNIINATILGQDISNTGYNGFAKLMVQYKQNDKLSFQLNGNYESPEIIPQGRTIARYFIDFSVRKDFGTRWSLNLSANDLFNSRRWGNVIETPELNQVTSRRWDVRNYRFNLTYKFGESDPSFFRKRSLRRSEGGGGGGDDGF